MDRQGGGAVWSDSAALETPLVMAGAAGDGFAVEVDGAVAVVGAAVAAQFPRDRRGTTC
jgi:hypothetical protein